MYRKEIVYDREARDYAMYLDGELTGFARTYHQAEVALDQLVFDLLAAGMHYSATQMDGDPPTDDNDPPEQGPCDDIEAPIDRPRCATCDGEGRIPCGGYGDQAGGWAETCPDCEGKTAILA